MKEIKLYRLLQQHTGEMNKIVIALYKGDISAAEAEKTAMEKLEQTLAAMEE